MPAEKSRIILASASPRRSELLASAGVEFTVCPADIDESPLPGEEPRGHVLRLAEGKARAAADLCDGDVFIGADTVVVCGSEILGKPSDDSDAAAMLRKLSGRAHQVITGFAVFDRTNGRILSDCVCTEVFFKPLTEAEISTYVATGCPRDKAGAYAIQGGAAGMVRRIEGSYTNVVGLPLCELLDVLRTVCGENQ